MEVTDNQGNHIIIDNDKLVGKNCLTFIHNTKHGEVCYKFYKKFVQSIKNRLWNVCNQPHVYQVHLMTLI